MKKRLDLLMVSRGMVESREKARAFIMEGAVFVNGIRCDKAGDQVDEAADIQLKEQVLPFVSRGGLKLQKALQVFPLQLADKVCADIGASTGGFTDCMLQSGASKVYAVDVGYGQLHWKLRNDARVVVMERQNARFMEPAWFDAAPTFASIDVSFISLKLILPPLFHCLADGGEVVALIKPQFEAGRSEIGKNGVVREAKTHVSVIQRTLEMAADCGYTILGLDFSPITGPKGNIEFLLYLKKDSTQPENELEGWSERIEDTVKKAHVTCM